MSKPNLGIALVGHAFMGRAHAQAWARVPLVWPDLTPRAEVRVVVGTEANRTAAAASALGAPRWTCRLDDALSDPGIDVIDVCSPGFTHETVAVAALNAEKHVLCEKPMANTLAQAQRMANAARTAAAHGCHAMVGFNYRRVPALSLAHKLIADGRLGVVRHLRLSYLQDWLTDPSFPLTWRLQADKAGSGALGDLGSHAIDLGRYLLGEEPGELTATTTTFVRRRPLPTAAAGLAASAGEGSGTVDVDDACAVIMRFPSGCLATLEATRFATGRKNALQLECYGERGSLAFDLERPNELVHFDAAGPTEIAGPARILVTEAVHPYLAAWWPPGHVLGWEHTFAHQAHDFLAGIRDGEPAQPDFADGLRTQAVLEAIGVSARAGTWVSAEKV